MLNLNEYFFFIMFLLCLIILTFFFFNFFLILLFMEYMIFSLYMYMYVFSLNNLMKLSFLFIYLPFCVCEGVLGLSLLVLFIRYVGNDKIKSLNLIYF
uniref:NADH-ubiquinone oxidoreductase chain 4L n=1 Tax=Helorus sp. ZJUH_2016017 TaxID=2491159 RepID=A0A3Q8U9U4_9HYME|nr:NADH dehydrogenase subunit 4L [Helorus sp. ZJUH_2016017]